MNIWLRHGRAYGFYSEGTVDQPGHFRKTLGLTQGTDGGHVGV